MTIHNQNDDEAQGPGETTNQGVDAGEYVLGTLDGRQRRLLDSQIHFDPDLLRDVAFWEEHLGRLALRLPPETPPPAAWTGIKNRLGLGQYRPKLAIWRGFALAASCAALVFASMLYMYVGTSPGTATESGDQPRRTAYASLIRDETYGVGWLITAGQDKRQLKVMALGHYQLPGSKSLELWLITPERVSGQSLGLIPARGEVTLPLPDNEDLVLSDRATFAISIEPEGGSPVGSPTGQTIFIAPVSADVG
ncbi:MAG: hypothetical protein CMN28_13945 [Salinisphaeraceae bacterium]|nr:hypothetical protein [Salinisphaeraceae bacterium]